MKILITESQKKELNELQWLESVNSHILERRIPMTPKIYQLISGKERIKTFHISDVHQINNIANLVGTKKIISTFTYMTSTTLSGVYGIQTKGGVLYELYGDLVIHSPNDIMSRPDPNGIRWLDSYELLPYDENREWNTIIRNFWIDKKIGDVMTKLNARDKEKTELIKQYFQLAEKFVLDNKKGIKNHIISRRLNHSSWNEILVNNIEIHDVFWSQKHTKRIYDEILARHNVLKSGNIKKYEYEFGTKRKPLSPRENDILKYYPMWVNSKQHKLESMANGTVYKDTEMTALDFVRERGGYVNRTDYLSNFSNDKFN